VVGQPRLEGQPAGTASASTHHGRHVCTGTRRHAEGTDTARSADPHAEACLRSDSIRSMAVQVANLLGAGAHLHTIFTWPTHKRYNAALC
jgi:hypothetical protein